MFILFPSGEISYYPSKGCIKRATAKNFLSFLSYNTKAVPSSFVLQNRTNPYFLLLRHNVCSRTCVLEQCEMVLLQFERRAWLHDSRLASQPGGRLALEMGQVMRWVAGGLSSCFRKIEKALDTAVNRCCALPRWLGPNYSGDLQLEENYPSGGKLEQL